MGKFIWVICLGMAMMLGACNKASQEVSPDLTSSLVGKFNVTYMIASPAGQPRPGGTTSFVRFERKTNNTLQVTVRIDDGTVQINDQYEARVAPVSPNEYSQPEAGLRSRYKLTAANLSKLGGESVSQVSLFQDGTIRAAMAYVNSLNQTITLAINL